MTLTFAHSTQRPHTDDFSLIHKPIPIVHLRDEGIRERAAKVLVGCEKVGVSSSRLADHLRYANFPITKLFDLCGARQRSDRLSTPTHSFGAGCFRPEDQEGAKGCLMR